MMSTLDDKKREFESRLQNRRDRQSGSEPASVERPSDVDLEQRFQAWDAVLAKRLAEFRNEPSEPGEPEHVESPIDARNGSAPEDTLGPSTSGIRQRLFGHHTPTLERWLIDLDSMLINELGFRKHKVQKDETASLRIVDQEQEIRRAILDFCPFLTSTDLNGLDGHKLGVIHIPGQGTFLNRSHYSQSFKQSFDQVNQEQRAHLISEVAVERWGWGFLQEYTTLGINAGQAGLWPALLAKHLGLPLKDQKVAEKIGALQRSWMFLDAGWSDWIWQYVMFKAHQPVGVGLFQRPRPGRIMEALIKVVDLFPLYIAPFGVRLRLRNIIDLAKYLFLEESDLATVTLHSTLLQTQAFCLTHDERFADLTGSSMSKWLGRLYFAKLESNVGIYAVPYATLIAGHITEHTHLARLQDGEVDKTERDVRLYPDTRLALISKIDSRVKYDPRAMYIAAWERLKLESPSEYFG
jgi:hypothetical protein